MIKKHIIGNLVVILIWYLFSFAIGTRFVPYPHQVFYFIFTSFDQILPHLLATLMRLAWGFSLALLVGVSTGIAMGLNSKIDGLLSPLIYALNPIPKSALTPVFLIVFGMNDIARVMIVVFIIIFPMIVSIKDATKLIPKEYFIISKTLGYTKFETLYKVIFKAILPSLLSTVKVTIAIAIAVLYITENIGSNLGLGYYIATNNGINYIEMYSGIVVLSMIGYIIVIIMDVILYTKCKWINVD